MAQLFALSVGLFDQLENVRFGSVADVGDSPRDFRLDNLLCWPDRPLSAKSGRWIYEFKPPRGEPADLRLKLDGFIGRKDMALTSRPGSVATGSPINLCSAVQLRGSQAN
jgi:hypothetical protein